MSKKKNILITGGSGFIGSHLIRSYESKYNFLIISRPCTLHSATANFPTQQVISFKDLSLEKLLEFKPEFLIHLASSSSFQVEGTSLQDMIQSNIEQPTLILDLFVKSGGRKILNIGSYWQHMNNEMYAPNSIYAATKKAFEDIIEYYVKQVALQPVTLKLFDTYGPGDNRKKILKLVHEASISNQNLDLTSGDQLINLNHVVDVVSAIDKSLDLFREGHQFYLVKSPQTLTLKQLITKYLEINNLKAQLTWGTRPHSSRDFFKEITVHPIVPDWSSTIALDEGLKGLYQN